MKKIVSKILSFVCLKPIVLRVIKKIKRYYTFRIKNRFNLCVIYQMINYKSIPVIIISFNQLYYLKQLVFFLKKNGYCNIVIIDNNSTYKPLLDYFDIIDSTVIIHRLKENFGHMVFWKNEELFEKYSKGYYIVTDPDIVPVSECPKNFILYFKRILDRNDEVTKVGFSLRIDDIPDSNPNKQKVINWEQQFRKNIKNDGNFKAPIDTTFALYKPSYKYNNEDFYDAIRTKEPYCAIHGGWYLDIENLTEEQAFYFANCNESSSWRTDEQGNLYTKDYD